MLLELHKSATLAYSTAAVATLLRLLNEGNTGAIPSWSAGRAILPGRMSDQVLISIYKKRRTSLDAGRHTHEISR